VFFVKFEKFSEKFHVFPVMKSKIFFRSLEKIGTKEGQEIAGL
jgi:hypothetical protein